MSEQIGHCVRKLDVEQRCAQTHIKLICVGVGVGGILFEGIVQVFITQETQVHGGVGCQVELIATVNIELCRARDTDSGG